MESDEKDKSKGERLKTQGRELQRAIIRKYGIDMDPLFAINDAMDLADWILDSNRYIIETIDPDDDKAKAAEDKVTTFHDALREIKIYTRHTENNKTDPYVYSYLKAALLDEGFDYIIREAIADGTVDDKLETFVREGALPDLGFERGFGKATIRLAASLPTAEYDFSNEDLE